MSSKPSSMVLLACVSALAATACGRSLELERGATEGGFGVTVSSVQGPGPSGQGGASNGDPTAAGGSSPGVTAGPAGPSGQGGFGVTVGQGGTDDVGPGPGPGGQGGFGQGPGPGPGGQGGFGQGPGPGPGGQGGGSTICGDFGDPCTSCISSECPARWCDCTDNPECLALLQCTGNCGDQGCIEDCQTEHPTGVSDLYLVVDCADEQCGNACPGVGKVPDCSECLFQSCESESNTCFAEPECLGLYDCLIECDPIDLECNSDCYDAFGDGIGPLQDLLQCADTECQNVCG